MKLIHKKLVNLMNFSPSVYNCFLNKEQDVLSYTDSYKKGEYQSAWM